MKALSHESVLESESALSFERAFSVINLKRGIAARTSLFNWLQVPEGATHQREETVRYSTSFSQSQMLRHRMVLKFHYFKSVIAQLYFRVVSVRAGTRPLRCNIVVQNPLAR